MAAGLPLHAGGKRRRGRGRCVHGGAAASRGRVRFAFLVGVPKHHEVEHLCLPAHGSYLQLRRLRRRGWAWRPWLWPPRPPAGRAGAVPRPVPPRRGRTGPRPAAWRPAPRASRARAASRRWCTQCIQSLLVIVAGRQWGCARVLRGLSHRGRGVQRGEQRHLALSVHLIDLEVAVPTSAVERRRAVRAPGGCPRAACWPRAPSSA